MLPNLYFKIEIRENNIKGLLKSVLPRLFVSTDIDECQGQTHNCDINARCNNSIGLYLCTCLQGYSGDGVECYGMEIDLKCCRVRRGLYYAFFTIFLDREN